MALYKQWLALREQVGGESPDFEKVAKKNLLSRSASKPYGGANSENVDPQETTVVMPQYPKMPLTDSAARIAV